MRVRFAPAGSPAAADARAGRGARLGENFPWAQPFLRGRPCDSPRIARANGAPGQRGFLSLPVVLGVSVSEWGKAVIGADVRAMEKLDVATAVREAETKRSAG